MSKTLPTSNLQIIAIDQIEVLNPRDRNARTFDDIVENIKNIGLKKPITVTPRKNADGSSKFLLICGEGRLKAFKSLGEKTIPAIVVYVTDEDAFIMSLAENIARRQARTMELLAGIEQLRDQGYDKIEIAQKTGLSREYIQGILQLLKNGEERLLIAVESGRIPLNAALTICGAGGSDKDVQTALQEAYENGTLRGNHLIYARRLIEKRRSLGRSVSKTGPRKVPGLTSSSLVRAYQNEVGRQKLMVKKAELVHQRLLFVTQALRQLLGNENFTNLLRAEGLDTLPQYLAQRVWEGTHTL
jgi:ParB family transcriptional regulator, chromosome partitioning protein